MHSLKRRIYLFYISFILIINCSPNTQNDENMVTAEKILGNPAYPAICFGGYRTTDRNNQPTVEELKEDLRILFAMGIRLLRTYNVYYDEAENLLKAIDELRKEQLGFEMYLMLGAWIDCKDARNKPVHHLESEANETEINNAVRLANVYPHLVLMIAVGNEAMVHWATDYYVTPNIILKWVNHLQSLKAKGKLAKHIWITSSDNFASWGGGDSSYHNPDLEALWHAVDFVSMHTYPMHDTHYNPEFWHSTAEDSKLDTLQQVQLAMQRAIYYAKNQYESVKRYMVQIGANKPIHIGETGWASQSNEHYGQQGSKATDEYKMALYYHAVYQWSKEAKITTWFFEAFDEPWKDAKNPLGSENHFGLFNTQSQAKMCLWPLVDAGVFNGLTRAGKPITKTFNGDTLSVLNQILPPPFAHFQHAY